MILDAEDMRYEILLGRTALKTRLTTYHEALARGLVYAINTHDWARLELGVVVIHWIRRPSASASGEARPASGGHVVVLADGWHW